MGKKYGKPPLVEALCEFHFIAGQPWDMTIPGLLYEKISRDFPDKKQQTSFGVGFSLKNGGIQQKVQARQMMQFWSENKTALVQVGQDLLTINHLMPYPTWEVFKPMITDNLQKYLDIAKPKGFKGLALRYINKVAFQQASVDLDDFFKYKATVPEELPQRYGALNLNIEIPYEDERDRLAMTLATIIPDKKDVIALTLDISYAMIKADAVSIEAISDWIEKAHDIVESAFEASITDKAREFFEEGK